MLDALRSQLRARHSQLVGTRQMGEQRLAERQQRTRRARQLLDSERAAEESESGAAAHHTAQHNIRRASLTRSIQTATSDTQRAEQRIAQLNQQVQQSSERWQRMRDQHKARMEHTRVRAAPSTHTLPCGAEVAPSLCVLPASALFRSSSTVLLLVRVLGRQPPLALRRTTRRRGGRWHLQSERAAANANGRNSSALHR